MQSFSKALMWPGLSLMRSLPFAAKLWLMAVVVATPLGILLTQIVRTSAADLDYVAREVAGVRVAEQLHTLAALVQTHRGLSSRVGHGDTAAQAQRAAVAAQMDTQLDATERVVHGLSSFQLADAWQATHQAIRGLKTLGTSHGVADVFDRHTDQVTALRHLLLITGERSGLLLDPMADTFFMMDIVLDRNLPWTEAIGLARGAGAGLLAKGQATPLERARVLQMASDIGLHAAETQQRVDALQRAGGVVPSSFKTALAGSQALAGQINTLFANDTLTTSAAAYFEAATAVLAQVAAFNTATSQQLTAALTQREADTRVKLAALVLGCVLGVAALAYLAVAFSANVLGALRALSTGVDKVANGDLSHRFVIHGRDEFAHIGQRIEDMADKLSTVVAEIRSSAVRVSGTGQALAQGSQALAQRTEEQATSLEQFVVTVGQLSQQVAAGAGKVQVVEGLTGTLCAQAESGGHAMRDAVASLGELQSSSQRVSDIVAVIDGIAFQTNILALNAAVEAARAGDTGRGFAVVASEVRQLALRSGDAAKEIRGLIAHSQAQVQGTAQRVQGTSAVLEALISGVRGVSETLRDISADSASQSRGLADMAAGVGSLDEITRQNAGMVDESTRSSHALAERARILTSAVNDMRLRQGSADEADALAQRARTLISSQGLQAAMPALHSEAQGFVDRDLYVFVLDRMGCYVVHGAKPAAQGKRVHDVPGIDGERFVQDIFAAHDGQWVEYNIVHPDTGKVLPKASVIYRLSETQVLGCGVYRLSAATAT